MTNYQDGLLARRIASRINPKIERGKDVAILTFIISRLIFAGFAGFVLSRYYAISFVEAGSYVFVGASVSMVIALSLKIGWRSRLESSAGIT